MFTGPFIRFGIALIFYSILLALQVYRISRMTLVPSLMEIVLPNLVKILSDGCNPLKILIFSGELLSVLLWKRVYEVLPETTIINLYGTTEVMIFLLFQMSLKFFFFWLACGCGQIFLTSLLMKKFFAVSSCKVRLVTRSALVTSLVLLHLLAIIFVLYCYFPLIF